MKSFKILWMAGLLLVFISSQVFSQAQPDKKAAELKRLEASVKAAEAKVALNEKQLRTADSLFKTGTQMVNESKSEIKALEADKKKLDKEYATSKKPLEKSVTSKDKEEATNARTEMKNLDTKYKADAKAIDTKMKDANKKLTTGNTNIGKGKAGKKTATDALKMSKANLEAAQAKFDAASGAGDESGKATKKKKK